MVALLPHEERTCHRMSILHRGLIRGAMENNALGAKTLREGQKVPTILHVLSSINTVHLHRKTLGLNIGAQNSFLILVPSNLGMPLLLQNLHYSPTCCM